MSESISLAFLLAFQENDGEFTFAVKQRDDDEPKAVKFINESCCSSPDSFFVAGHEFGPSVLVHACSFETAWEAWIDECPTIPPEDLIEAYGIVDDDALRARYRAGHGETPHYGSEAWNVWHDGLRLAQTWYLRNWEEENPGKDRPDLIEGYQYQSNASGTGIVDVGHYAWMYEIDPSCVIVTRKEATE